MSIEAFDVFRFLRRVLQVIFPKKLFGKINEPALMKFLKKLVFYKRFESFTIEEVFYNLNLNHLSWFKRGYNPLFKKEINWS